MSSKRSGFEDRLASVLEPEGFEYEPFKVPYVVVHKYTPDFVFTEGDNSPEILVEAKGWFRPGDRQKYKAIRDSLIGSQELVFVLQYPLKRVQKGAKLTMSGWCDKEDIVWFATAEELIGYANPD